MRRGFTVVELLIVIVVIGILAAVTLVAFGTVQQRARVATVTSSLTQAKKKLEAYRVENGAYPMTGSLASAGVSDGETTYQYTSNGTAFCVTATYAGVSYKLSDAAVASSGGCTGHGQGGVSAVTNLIQNPSVEASLTGYAGPNGATLARTTTQARSGTNSVLVTMANGGGTSNGAHVSSGYSVPTNLQPNTQYQFSAWVYVPTGTVDVTLSTQGTGVAVVCSGGARMTATKNAWTRISCGFTTAASGGLSLYVLNSVASTAGMQFYVDSVMVTEGTLSGYADGDTTDWMWNGTAHNATSTGPAQ